MSGYISTIHHGNGKKAVENVSTCEMSDNQVPVRMRESVSPKF
jgi:hypothetical protein